VPASTTVSEEAVVRMGILNEYLEKAGNGLVGAFREAIRRENGPVTTLERARLRTTLDCYTRKLKNHTVSDIVQDEPRTNARGGVGAPMSRARVQQLAGQRQAGQRQAGQGVAVALKPTIANSSAANFAEARIQTMWRRSSGSSVEHLERALLGDGFLPEGAVSLSAKRGVHAQRGRAMATETESASSVEQRRERDHAAKQVAQAAAAAAASVSVSMASTSASTAGPRVRAPLTNNQGGALRASSSEAGAAAAAAAAASNAGATPVWAAGSSAGVSSAPARASSPSGAAAAAASGPHGRATQPAAAAPAASRQPCSSTPWGVRVAWQRALHR